ncbi:protein of unassigned function [Methylobacterium oryzae CBMB20]|uniref:Protein of unassigned function n=1 Tax=Methylobacterium oryzae CBMB20 TaxID=693986 RepID=A0A089Q1Y8_9HYPH|nr:protein of unassigned function [Methylobacterium oryzae CBMB20]
MRAVERIQFRVMAGTERQHLNLLLISTFLCQFFHKLIKYQ